MIRLYKQAIQRYMSIGVLKSDSFKISAFCKIAMLKSFSLVTKGLFQKYFPGNFDICLTKAFLEYLSTNTFGIYSTEILN